MNSFLLQETREKGRAGETIEKDLLESGKRDRVQGEDDQRRVLDEELSETLVLVFPVFGVDVRFEESPGGRHPLSAADVSLADIDSLGG